VTEQLDRCAVDADIVARPTDSEFLTTGGEFADEIVEFPIEGVSSCFLPERCNRGFSHGVPVHEEVMGARIGRIEVEATVCN
jgi:hypothetical protein